jgi:gas vesicle protein
MRNIRTKDGWKDWTRLALKLGLILTDSKVRGAINDEVMDQVSGVKDKISDKYGDLNDTVTSKYQHAADRLEAASDALQGRTAWGGRALGFLAGIGVGAGLGLLLAPASGVETRRAVRDKVVDIKDSVFDSAASAADTFRQSAARVASTGTEG